MNIGGKIAAVKKLNIGEIHTVPPPEELEEAIAEIFDRFGGGEKFIRSSGEVFIKPNGIDFKKYTHTEPAFIEALINYMKKSGARKIYLMENSTQGNFTRAVFAITGYKDVCKRTGAVPVYLDEMKTVKVKLPDNSYDGKKFGLTEFSIPRIIADKLIKKAAEVTYIDVPKLKTHSMTGVTLGIKNQWAFPAHTDRMADHNYNLHAKLVEVLKIVRPDFTLIEGITGTIYGHYPATALVDKCVIPFGIIIGSDNVVAADIVGASVFGFTPKDVRHISIALKEGLGGPIKTAEDVEIEGDKIAPPKIDGGKYPSDLYPLFPPELNVVRGKELACKEGCINNPLTLIQVLYADFGGKGRVDLVVGKGHDPEILDGLEGPVLIAGDCAVKETADRLIKRLGKKKVYISPGCNNLAASLSALMHIMKVGPFDMIPIGKLRALKLLMSAKLHGSRAVTPALKSRLFKSV